MTTNLAVLGSPISHSLSPRLHLAAYRSLGLDFSYQAIDCPAGSLSQTISSNSLSGCSITMPLKEEAYNQAASVDEHSKITGVSNTLISTNAGLAAYNTDVFGIQMALSHLEGIESVAIIGTGATARSAVVAVLELFPNAAIGVSGRRESQVQALVDFGKSLGATAIFGQELPTESIENNLVISTVPSGALDSYWLSQGKKYSGWLFDVAYHPWPSKAAECFSTDRTISGIEMLKWQAAKQVQLFCSEFAPNVDVSVPEVFQIMTSELNRTI